MSLVVAKVPRSAKPAVEILPVLVIANCEAVLVTGGVPVLVATAVSMQAVERGEAQPPVLMRELVKFDEERER